MFFRPRLTTSRTIARLIQEVHAGPPESSAAAEKTFQRPANPGAERCESAYEIADRAVAVGDDGDAGGGGAVGVGYDGEAAGVAEQR